jgi:hypothetical protein
LSFSRRNFAASRLRVILGTSSHEATEDGDLRAAVRFLG